MRKKNNCSECNKEIDGRSKKCKPCASTKHGKTLIEVFCLDCNKKLCKNAFYYGYTRCRSCTFKLKSKLDPTSNPNYKNGLSNIKSNCIDCNKELSNRALSKNVLRCNSCAAKERIKSKKYWFLGLKGSDNPAWKGGISTLTNLIRNCPKYKDWRKSCFNRDHYTCQECKQVSGKLEVNHLKRFSEILSEFLTKYNQFSPIEDKETLLRLTETYEPFWDLNNGQTLCVNCHKKTDSYGNKMKGTKV